MDGWDKNMSIWIAADWPYFSRQRDEFRKRYAARARELDPVKAAVTKKIKERGFISSKEIEEERKVEWAWGPTTIGRAVLESMYHCGELVVHHREGTRKYYALAEELLPRSVVDAPDPNGTLEEYHRWFVKRRIAAVGLLWDRSGDAWLGTRIGGADRSRAIQELARKNEIMPVQIEGMDETFYTLPSAAPLMDEDEEYREASFLAPLDNLLWDRKLISRLFDFDYTWEVYIPAAKRKHGYYVLPIVYGDRFVGRFEPVFDRKAQVLHIRNWWWEAGVVVDGALTDALSSCLEDFAAFLAAEKITSSYDVPEAVSNMCVP